MDERTTETPETGAGPQPEADCRRNRTVPLLPQVMGRESG